LAWNLANTNKKYSKNLFNSLIIVVLAVSIFGFLQYFIYPDIRSFTVWGWDDHYFRLFGTFLDPGHTSIILVFGFLAALVKYLEKKDKKLLLVLTTIIISIAFTYSRAGYLALTSGLFTIFLLKKNLRLFFILIMTFALLVIFLPRPGGEGVKLERTASIVLRMEDYRDTLTIFDKAPLFGVGYNNMCIARAKFLDQVNLNSHACSGSASSLLLVLATTGILGFLIFANLVRKLVADLTKNTYGLTFLSCLVALLVHSLFINSLFYPWVLGWMGILLSISLRPSRE
jgi:O-antigen ligase